ncbi:MAG: GNAT family N-acetyltransferase [Paludibacterium sp.]|uniref:GNAT family N-acetyltransferase n=1 Tax=Paludibacterium sp. TaxID=1917523 RepID=UPI0025FEE8E7|nr:GNAT family N-acetyltransferase [Paludibacterium sp.]MBV8047936.1 GNAT family N-acetyltransferase [Paludibacterium sp.]MBV8648963.1 GNAT family N-acetyltransferase [Paludibacterium sp.]
MQAILELTDQPADSELAQISDALDQFNIQVSGVADRTPLAILVRDPETHAVLGGLTGRTSLGLLFVDIFYLPEQLRGQGMGSRMLKMAEDEGRRRGCNAAVLYTISFQAPEFYQRNGWQRFGEIPCQPAGTSRVFMSKRLA